MATAGASVDPPTSHPATYLHTISSIHSFRVEVSAKALYCNYIATRSSFFENCGQST